MRNGFCFVDLARGRADRGRATARCIAGRCDRSSDLRF
jgi:hypothetical protein